MSAMNRKPLIGCTTYRKQTGDSPALDILGLMLSYLQAIAAAGGVPVMIPLGLSEADVQDVIQQMDGILLPGGGDIDPSVYHGDGHPTVGGIDEDRDRVELVVARTAVAQQKPLLAICRGLQVLDVVFAVNIVGEAALEAMNATSARFPRGTDEFLAAGVAKAECVAIDCPRVDDAPATLECRVVKLVDLIGPEKLLLGEVVGIHLRDDCLVDGRLDPARYHPAARLGYHDYTFVREVRELRRPKDPAQE